MEIDLSAKLSASLDTMAEQQKKSAEIMARIQSALTHIPLDTPVTGGGKTNATGTVVFNCRGPAQGRLWQVRRLVIGGPSKGKALFYSVGSPPASTGGQVTGLVDLSSTWPNRAFYSTHQFVVVPSNLLFVVVVTATATTDVQVDGAVEDYDLAAYRGAVEL